MLSRNYRLTILTAILLISNLSFGQTLEDNWNDFLHYTKIARLDLAKGYAQAILESAPDPIVLLNFSQQNPTGYQMLLDMKEKAADPELVQLSTQILDLIEKGRFLKRTDPRIIVEQIERLSVSERGYLAAVKNLRNSGEYAILYMLDAMADPERKEQFGDLVSALPQIGRDAIRPLAAALQVKNTGVKAEIIKAMGGIGYPQSLPYLKYVGENDPSPELRQLANKSIVDIDPAAAIPAARLFYMLGEEYYYHGESLAPAEDADFANIWFWDPNEKRLDRHEVDREYFYELMAMRCCEWALKADQTFGQAIGLWLAAFFKAESTGLDMPSYFGPGHADAAIYATTAGPEYLHQALARAVKDKNAYVALGVIEALANIAGEKSLLYRVGAAQPLSQALTFDNKAVRYSAAIAIAAAGPMQDFPEKNFVVTNLIDALNGPEDVSADEQLANEWVDESYPLRAVKVMLKLTTTRNPVIDLSPAVQTLIDATTRRNEELQMLAGRTLAAFNNVNAQRQIAAMALNQDNSLEVRVEAFNSLAESAKRNANLLEIGAINAIYAIVSSTEGSDELRSAAASAFGALNLPSQEVKRLILDQAKS